MYILRNTDWGGISPSVSKKNPCCFSWNKSYLLSLLYQLIQHKIFVFFVQTQICCFFPIICFVCSFLHTSAYTVHYNSLPFCDSSTADLFYNIRRGALHFLIISAKSVTRCCSLTSLHRIRDVLFQARNMNTWWGGTSEKCKSLPFQGHWRDLQAQLNKLVSTMKYLEGIISFYRKHVVAVS